jgi:AcrR family transcriptional regulator
MARPREFDVEKALDTALEVFWRRGYEGTSLTDLTTAIGINRPSLYAAFGNKEALFRAVVERYQNGPAAYSHQALQEPSARAVVERLLNGAVDVAANPEGPGGCLMVQAALRCGDEGEPIRKELLARRNAGEAALRERFQRALEEGDLPAGSNPADLARYVVSVVHGMAVQAASGASREELLRVVAIALKAWPTPAHGRSGKGSARPKARRRRR